MKKYIMLACEILKDEIMHIIRESPVDYPIYFISSELHLHPEKLREFLQETIDQIENVDYILLPLGRCGNGTVGLVSQNATLVIPKSEDCINLLLSDQSLKVERPSKSSFFTKGWLQNKHTAANHEYLNTVEKFGKEQADMLTKIMYSAYEHFTLVNTGAYDMKEAYDLLTPLASVIPIEINEIPGKCGVLKKMLQLDLDDNFIFIAPGEKVQEKDFM